MQNCFVIQPFDSGKYDKRFEDVFKPAINAAGLNPYRVDMDPKVSIPIESIEEGIRNSTICLADITTDNPNVWYELGFAFAAGKPVIMVCSEERTGKKYPFDIQHRSIIPYLADSPSDFDKLQDRIKSKLIALLEKGAAIKQFSESESLAAVEGLTQPELLLLAVLAGLLFTPTSSLSIYYLKQEAEKAGLTGVGFSVGLRRLSNKQFIIQTEEYDERDGESYQALSITDQGWIWIDSHDSLFILHRSQGKDGSAENDKDVPF